MRVAIKVAFVLLVAAGAAIGLHRLVTGRNPPPLRGLALTGTIFVALVALDAAIGW